jgi:hypothetical protein
MPALGTLTHFLVKRTNCKPFANAPLEGLSIT